MCGFVGFSNFSRDISSDSHITKVMNGQIYRRGPDEEGFYSQKHIQFGHKRLIVIDPEGGKQPMSCTFYDNTYTICYNGQLYNTNELRDVLKENGFSFEGHCDTEVLLKAYIHYGYEVVKYLNGIFAFAIWDSNKQEVYIARDHFGIKPLYYTLFDNYFIFASEVKAILKFPGFQASIAEQGISELFGIGPAHTPGTCIFKDVHELKPAHYAIYNKSGLHIDRYWKLESKPHLDDFDSTCKKVKELLEDSIRRQLVSDVPLCTFLSGGLDSSIITTYASKHYKLQNMDTLNTFSVDYIDNDKNFVKSDFQPNSDKYYIDIITNTLGTKHHTIYIDTPELTEALEDAMIARDFPGMADVDSSLLLFCKNVKKQATVALSGECSDEIFGGYPWFFREDALNSNTFPWSIALDERQKLLHPDISKKIKLKEYIDYRYFESLSEVTILDEDTKETAEKRKIFHLNLNWFMQTLLDRTDRMSMYSGFEVRVPFCDYRLVEYVWNIPWEMKAYKGREKGLLRYIMEDTLPEEVVYRKKSPYPKTHNPNYLAKVKGMLSQIMKDNNSPINNILNREYILEILETNGAAFTRPWFGQLMTGPQLIAYLIQVNQWLEKYQPKIEL
jgi:asparagine synthase (glutamine-hydrolysing)